jgi:hypothetical protein
MPLENQTIKLIGKLNWKNFLGLSQMMVFLGSKTKIYGCSLRKKSMSFLNPSGCPQMLAKGCINIQSAHKQ